MLADALTLAETGVERYYHAELYRLKGELLEGVGAAPDEVERFFTIGVESAPEIGAKSLELRAATSRARLLIRLSRGAEARGVLAPVYGWFTEGFDTAGLRTAKAILEEL